ncbi:unnamed protein product [Orchesella dallaii]|uniref:Chromosome transmission fidelity protein 8 n=1 Tax=Orchesella dallaii TaxID=48710 RepID=A0ABP1QBC4_9HEXA
MQVFIQPFSNEEGLQEWGIIELQGDLDSKESGSLAGKLVGDLFYNKDGIPTFIIGHHILVGKAEKLEKPLAVLEKRHIQTKGKDDKTEYVVRAIVKRKLCFRDRPKPIVGSMQKVVNKTP